MFNVKDYVISVLKFESDTFVCSSCGVRIRKRILGDTCTCSNCGGTMHRV